MKANNHSEHTQNIGITLWLILIVLIKHPFFNVLKALYFDVLIFIINGIK